MHKITDMMKPNKQLTKMQHYVPKAYLQFFSNENKKTYAYFYSTNQIKHLGIDKLCCQSYLYEEIIQFEDIDDKRIFAANEIENSFIQREGEYAAIIKKLISNVQTYNEARLSVDEVDTLKTFLSLMVFRHPCFIHILNSFTKLTYDENPYKCKMKKLIPHFPDNVLSAILAYNHLENFISPHKGIMPKALKRTMDNAKLCILKANEASFITSDIPVVNIYGEANEIEYDLLGMPITPNLFLAFVDIDISIPNIATIDKNSIANINRKQTCKSILISSDKDTLLNIDKVTDYESSNNEEDIDFIFQMIGIDKESILKQYNEIMNTCRIKYWR